MRFRPSELQLEGIWERLGSEGLVGAVSIRVFARMVSSTLPDIEEIAELWYEGTACWQGSTFF
jgi:hypothetical protein